MQTGIEKLKCKKTGILFNPTNNKSGILSKHLKKNNIQFKDPFECFDQVFIVNNCKACGNELSKRQQLYCSNLCKLTDKDNIEARTFKKEKQDESKLIKCIHTGKTFKDISNYSGILTRHIKTIVKPKENLFDNFEIIDNPYYNKSKYKCKYCDWTTVDLENKTGCIVNHIIKSHDITIENHINNFPEEKDLLKQSYKNIVRKKLFEEDNNSFIECKICGEKLKKITEWHLQKHNYTTEKYKLEFNVDVMSSINFINESRKTYFENFDKINIVIKKSKAEQEICDFLISLSVVVETSKKIIYPKEIDIYLPEYNIAIEYDGLYYHSEFKGEKHTQYHLDKTEACAKKGIKLIHIFEDEWNNKKEIVKNKLLNLLNKNKNKLFARKCRIEEIDSDIKGEFLNKYHIQGSDRSNYSIGLFDNNELVSVMTFSHPKVIMKGKDTFDPGVYELSRFCSKINVVGGASKLLKYFVNKYKPTKIFSFADRRWSSNLSETMYDKIGFKMIKINKPTFYWLDRSFHKRYHRFNFTKQKIVNELGGNPNLTEVENMKLMGYDRIWDCGNFKYEMILR